MPLMVLGLVFATALVIVTLVLVSPHMQRRRAARNDCIAHCGDSGWNPAMATDAGGADCSAGDAGGGCDGGGGGGGD